MKLHNLTDNLHGFPHIRRNLHKMWGTEECRWYIHSIMRQDDRPYREGFPLYVFRTLYDISLLHDEEFPQFKPSPGPWDFTN